ncbi:hypothetical protein TeGR_g9291 [Tetraparma gracilis]|uniref:TraB family protein n=1 Tax=Tetraparma gracilis TaxID=2962635 RepID=A0ABQ6MRU3_9STRA|nr:hypothetical protein TeGR_g9291 [Tetraparma gracilis]
MSLLTSSHLPASTELYLIGTSHVSQSSALEVSQTISLAKPDNVFVELCPARAEGVRRGDTSSPGAGGVESFVKQIKTIVQMMGGADFASASPLAAAGARDFQDTDFEMLFKLLGMKSGMEFEAAIREADNQGIPVIPGDLPVEQTMAAVKASLPLLLKDFQRTMSVPLPPILQSAMAGGLKNFDAETLKTREAARAIRSYMLTAVPPVANAMLTQRDVHMAERLLGCEGRTVAVVGFAHFDGVVSEWQKLVERKSLSAPSSSKTITGSVII